MKRDAITTILLAALLTNAILDLPVEVTYTQQFGDQSITLTESMTVAQRLKLRNKKGFLCYGSL